MSIPSTMWAMRQHSALAGLTYEQVEVPIPGPGEVLVKMEYSPINPSDLSFLQGTYAEKPNYPVIPGIEGSGTVVAAGKGLLPKLRLGKRVSCTSTKGYGGSWAEYMLTSAMHVIPIGQLDLQQASMLIVNPLTALSFIDIAKKNNHKAIINNAAFGALGKMISRLAKREGMDCINIVHKQEYVDDLKAEGNSIVLDTESRTFEEDYKTKTDELTARLILDPVGGKQGSRLLRLAPPKSTLLLYANLSESEICIDSRILVQEDKQIQGFYLANYSAQKNIIKSLLDTKKVQKLVGSELQTNIHKVVKLNELNEALKIYKNNMSKGKVIIKI